MSCGAPETLLLTVAKDGTVRMGVPPNHHQDNYPARALVLGKLENFSHVLCSPEGELFCVRGEDLYRGPMMSHKDVDWFSTAKRVGKCDWNKFKNLFFTPCGELCGITNNGEFYKGPQPDNENSSWMYGQATKIGAKGWDLCEAVTCDQSGDLYVVTKDDKLVQAKPPTRAQDYEEWLKTSTERGGSGWLRLCHFMSFTPGQRDPLWCVDKEDGNIYRGSIPEDGTYVDKAEHLGFGYHGFGFLAFTEDKTIIDVIKCDLQHEPWGPRYSNPRVIEDRIYDNRYSSSPLKHSFTFDATLTEFGSFSNDHGFIFAAGADKFGSEMSNLLMNHEAVRRILLSKNGNWSSRETNENKVRFSSSYEVEVPPRKAIQVEASVMKGDLAVQYRATVRTLYGFIKEIRGSWNVSIYNKLTIRQVDYSGQ
ncbi:hypothetical protein GDO81_020450 [Engystomops pustulosus]|uniref:Tachylectin 2 domain-containing protein n=2 Tax=Engystomops pustulosus TaxID=76066 RepID=A0AAV6YXM2_ENGPU|nr:hypothetical protein GDO81_020450 [Engystomops pustulosus]